MRCQPRNKGKGFILPAYAGLLDNTFGIAEPQGKGGLVPMNVFRRDTPLAKVWFVKASRNPESPRVEGYLIDSTLPDLIVHIAIGVQ